MSEWTTRVETHGIWEAIQTLKQALDGVVLAEQDAPEVAGDLTRIRTVADVMESRLRAADPIFLAPGPLSSTQKQIQAATSSVAQFQSVRDRAQLVAANQQMDSALQQAATLGLPIAPGTETQISIADLRQQAELAAKALAERETALKKALEQLTAQAAATSKEVTDQKTRLDKAIAQYQEQFSASEAKRAEQFTEAQGRLDKALAQHQEQSAAAEAKRVDQFNEAQQVRTQRMDQLTIDAQKRNLDALEAAKGTFDSLRSEVDAKAAEQRDAQSQLASALIKELTTDRDEAKKLMHVIGSTGMAGAYQTTANSSRRRAFLWQTITAISMVGLIGFAIGAYAATQGSTIMWAAVAARVFVTLTFGVLAAYAARQADRYAELEQTNRRVEMELSSLSPYLATLPPESQHKLKADLAAKLFGNPEADKTVAKSPAGATSGTTIDALKPVLELALQLIKKDK